MVDFERIRKLRERAGLSKSRMAQKAGFATTQQWHAIEVGRRPDLRISTIDRIAAALGVKARDLLK